MELKVLYEDKELIVVIKPAGVQSQSSSGFEEDMVSLIKKHIAGKVGMFSANAGAAGVTEAYGAAQGGKSGTKAANVGGNISKTVAEPYVGVIHRLDTMVEGVMVYAKTKEAAAALSKQVRDGDIGKKYQAVLCGIPKEKSGRLSDYLVQDNKANMSRVAKPSEIGAKSSKPEAKASGQNDKATESRSGSSKSGTKSGSGAAGDSGAKLAELNYKLIDKKFVGGEQLSRVEIELLTGRHHQIRVQFSSRDLPILGDVKYGGRKADRLYLVSNEISFTHPKTKKKMTYKGCELQIPQ